MGGDLGVPSNPTIVICLLPADSQLRFSTLHKHLSAFCQFIFHHIMLPHPQSVAKTGSSLSALQRECQLRRSAFPNQTDNLCLRWCSRRSKNYSFSIVTSWWEVIKSRSPHTTGPPISPRLPRKRRMSFGTVIWQCWAE